MTRVRDPDPTIDYVQFWLEHATKSILTKPKSGVHHWTHANYSGGYTGWEESMSVVYFSPRTLEEKFLQGQVHEVMLAALDWALRHAEQNTPSAWTVWDGMDLTEAYRLSHMVVKVDPLLAASLKVRLNRICSKMNVNLAEVADDNFGILMGPPGIPW